MSNTAEGIARAIYDELLNQVRADRLVKAACQRVGDLLMVHDQAIDLAAYRRIFVAGAGKASVSMANAVAELVPPEGGILEGGLVVAKEPAEADGFEVIIGNHPLPDEGSLQAGARMIDFAQACGAGDLVIFCLSGGASALMEALLPGLHLDLLHKLTSRLLADGSPIQTINAVRKSVSRIKGGGLSQYFGEADVVVLVLSDVAASDPSVIGSGPLYQESPRQWEDRQRLCRYWLMRQEDSFSNSLLEMIAHEIPPPPSPHVRSHFVVGSPSMLLPVAAELATLRGLQPMAYQDPLRGEAQEQAAAIWNLAKVKLDRGERNFCMLFAGETTVTLNGADGKGGRAQEMALVAASLIDRPGVAFLAAGTDGTDGPTDAAGGLVSLGTRSGHENDMAQAIESHNSYAWLQQCGALIKTGPTGTNLTDIVVVVAKETV